MSCLLCPQFRFLHSSCSQFVQPKKTNPPHFFPNPTLNCLSRETLSAFRSGIRNVELEEEEEEEERHIWHTHFLLPPSRPPLFWGIMAGRPNSWNRHFRWRHMKNISSKRYSKSENAAINHHAKSVKWVIEMGVIWSSASPLLLFQMKDEGRDGGKTLKQLARKKSNQKAHGVFPPATSGKKKVSRSQSLLAAFF